MELPAVLAIYMVLNVAVVFVDAGHEIASSCSNRTGIFNIPVVHGPIVVC